MGILTALRKTFGNVDRSTQLLAEIREGIANLTDVVNRRLQAGAATTDQATRTTRADQLLSEIRLGIANMTDAVNRSSQAQQRAQEDAVRRSEQMLVDIRHSLLQLADAMGGAPNNATQQGSADAPAQPTVGAAANHATRPVAPQAREVRFPAVEVSGSVAIAPSPRIRGN